MNQRFLRTLSSAALLLFTTPLRAAESGVVSVDAPAKDTVSLSWVRQKGAEECVSDRELARLIEQVVGPVLRPASASTLQIEGAVERSQAGYRVMIRVTDREGQSIGERELTSGEPRCSALTPQLLLVVAVIVDPDVLSRGLGEDVLRTLAERRQAEASAPPPAAPVTRAPPAPPAERHLEQEPLASAAASVQPPSNVGADASPAARDSASPNENDTFLFAGGGGAVGFTPALTPSFVFGLLRELSDAWALRAEYSYFLPQEVAFDSVRSQGGVIEIDALQLGAGLCARAFGDDHFSLRGCVGGFFGARRVTAEPLVDDETTYRTYFGPSLGAEASWMSESFWFLRGSAELGFFARQDRFVYQGHDHQEHEIFAPPRTPFSFGLGAGIRL